jgi:hypothetical protein
MRQHRRPSENSSIESVPHSSQGKTMGPKKQTDLAIGIPRSGNNFFKISE